MAPVKVGAEMEIEARVDRIGRNMAFTSCFIRDKREEGKVKLLC